MLHKYFLGFFMILGAADLVYGLLKGDRISVLIGGLIVFITFSMLRKRIQEEKKKRS